MILLVGGDWLSAGGGTSVVPPGFAQNVPTHIGNSSIPNSNSTHTPAPTSGMKKNPCPAAPPKGAHGSAQPVTTSSPNTLGTRTFTRPRLSGSLLSVTNPAILPVIAVLHSLEEPHQEFLVHALLKTTTSRRRNLTGPTAPTRSAAP